MSTLPAAHAADDLVSSVLPLSRSTRIGQTVTAFATVINSSGRALSGCGVTLPGFSGTLTYQMTNPTTNAVTGTPNTPFALAKDASQSLVLALTPQTMISPTVERFVFQCAGANAGPGIDGINTLLLSSDAAQPPDVVALAATPSRDGTLQLNGTQTQVFAVATVNIGVSAPIAVSVDWGDIKLPLYVAICQTNPTTGACMNPPTSTVTVNIGANATPTFGFFVNASGPLPFFPSLVRAFVRFKDAGGTVRGSTSIALTTRNLPAVSATAGGFYRGVFRITSGPFTGRFGVTNFIISEDGEMRGVTFANPTTINSLFSGRAVIDNQFLYASAGSVVAALGFRLDDGSVLSPLAVAGAVSPHNFLAGQYQVNGETGSFYAGYDASVYERPSSLTAVGGGWRIRDLQGNAVGTLQVGANGSFTGSDSVGCGYSGTISIIDPRYNAYRVNLNVGSCGSATGPYEGLAGFDSTFSANDTLRFALSGATLAEVNAITRF